MTVATLPEIQIARQRRGWLLETEMWLPQGPDLLFSFFSDAANLQRLTPSSLRFEIISPLPIEMRQGALIEYRLRLHGVPIHWKTEIVEWDPPFRFVDVQLKGPYQFWRHEHQFLLDQGERGGTRAVDRVQYQMRCGRVLHPLFVRRDLRHIFAFRAAMMQQLFADGPGADPMTSADWCTANVRRVPR